MCLSLSDSHLGNIPSLQISFWRKNSTAWGPEANSLWNIFCDQLLTTTQKQKVLYSSVNDYDGKRYTTHTKLIMKCVLFNCVNSVHIEMAHDGMNCYFFFCLFNTFCILDYHHSIYRICRKQITSAKTRSTGDCSWLLSD